MSTGRSAAKARSSAGRSAWGELTDEAPTPIDLRAGKREYGIDIVREEALDNRLAAGQFSGVHTPIGPYFPSTPIGLAEPPRTS